jgi:hypothetical protein
MNENKNDFRKCMEAEIKYKTAYKDVEDKRAKIIDYDNQLAKVKVQFE